MKESRPKRNSEKCSASLRLSLQQIVKEYFMEKMNVTEYVEQMQNIKMKVHPLHTDKRQTLYQWKEFMNYINRNIS